jgi:hypothetical protein
MENGCVPSTPVNKDVSMAVIILAYVAYLAWFKPDKYLVIINAFAYPQSLPKENEPDAIRYGKFGSLIFIVALILLDFSLPWFSDLICGLW